MKKNILAFLAGVWALCGAFPGAMTCAAEELTDTGLAVRDINRAMDMIDVCWEKTMKGGDDNLYMADVYYVSAGFATGTSDIWPLTAALEAHCSLLEALEAVKEVEPELYNRTFEFYRHQLDLIIDNMDYYRGSYKLASYAVNHQVKPYAVPRANQRNTANVTGILNVYDDQMWLAREFIRAYRVTGTQKYLDLATELTDYVLEGWDCWRDNSGKEYGGITWGPGYNSKHACSNAPIIQPLVWLSEIYKDTDATVEYYYRDTANAVKHEPRNRSTHYLEFARKIYDWQKAKLESSTGVYYDMMGADGTIKVERGYRQHVDCGGAVGNFYSYNTGTMIAGGAELYRVTGEVAFRTDLTKSSRGSVSEFGISNRGKLCDFKTDETAMNGFNTWFNNVLMRGFYYAEPYCNGNYATRGLDVFQTNLDYAFENHNRGNMLPIHLRDGWESETRTKPFHQFAFAAQYGILAKRLLERAAQSGVADVTADSAEPTDDTVYTLTGVSLGRLSDVRSTLAPGIYVSQGRKILIR